MILEVADIQIRAGLQQAFDEATARGVSSVIAHADGYRDHCVLKGIESPERFLLLVYWETIESHTVGFRQSPEFAEWRAIVGPHLGVAGREERQARSCARPLLLWCSGMSAIQSVRWILPQT